MARRFNFSNHRMDYRYLGIEGYLFTSGYGQLNHSQAVSMCGDSLYTWAVPVYPKSHKEALIIAKHFEAKLPIWVNESCALLTRGGKILENVNCNEKHNYACQYTMRKYNLNKPRWEELVPGKE